MKNYFKPILFLVLSQWAHFVSSSSKKKLRRHGFREQIVWGPATDPLRATGIKGSLRAVKKTKQDN